MDLSSLSQRHRQLEEDHLYFFTRKQIRSVRAWFEDIEMVAQMIDADESVLLEQAVELLIDGAERLYWQRRKVLITWSDFKQGMIALLAQFDKDSKRNNNTNATMQSVILMKERRRTIAWHPQHVAHYRSYHASKSSSTNQTPVCSSSPSPLFELYPFEDPWPNGTESWHIHEIRPQRSSFTTRLDSEMLMITPQIMVEQKHEPMQSALQSNQNVLEFASTIDPISFLPVKLPTDMNDIVDMDVCLQKSLRSSKTAIASNVLKQKQQHRFVRNLKDLSNGSLLSSHFVSQMQLRDQSRNLLLQQIGVHSTVLLLCLFTVLIRFDIVHCLTYLIYSVTKESQTFASILFVGTILTICSHHLKHLTPYVKTIETLRKLESLLIYPIT
ncbi:unnamed protein product [Rotaria socialis]|uniref:Uncharacterized protein n=1 Tax=Rotaria socialis TaxID=392032 RepID=A0A817WRR1_9BILA|nr:unnamed protein product [Rotaria socialis]CAF4604362.1 unnamed protein product [Rotaria socialis]